MNDLQAAPTAALSIKGLTKRFSGTLALSNVNMSVAAGEIHALLGANGAGKSTLIKILAGVVKADEGLVRVGGLGLDEALGAGRLSFVHQDLGLIDSMSIGENIAIVYGYAKRSGLIDWRAVNAVGASALERLGTPLPLGALVGDLSQAEKSLVAIARALLSDTDILVLDEPTASLPGADVGKLFDALLGLRAQNVGIVYVTHRLDEIFRLADAVTVLRDGRVVASYASVAALSPDSLVTDICGKRLAISGYAGRSAGADEALGVRGLCVGHVGPVSFTTARGEVVGLAGLRGQGHELIGRAIAGVETPASGIIAIDGKPAAYRSPRAALAAGVGFVSGKRVEESLALTMTVRENLFMNPLNFSRGPLSAITRSAELASAREVLAPFDVRPSDPDRDVATLSGGNQQKVVLARLMNRGYRLMVLEEPTIGVDVGAKQEIYRILSEAATKGAACLIISSDLDELLQVCDRVLAFRPDGTIVELHRHELSIEALTHEVSGAELHLGSRAASSQPGLAT